MKTRTFVVVAACVAVALVVRAKVSAPGLRRFSIEEAAIREVIIESIPELNLLAGHIPRPSAYGDNRWKSQSLGNGSSSAGKDPFGVGIVKTTWQVVAREPSDSGSGDPKIHLVVRLRMGRWLWPTRTSVSVSETGRPEDGRGRALLVSRLEARGFELR